jgi:hypothetical protein
LKEFQPISVFCHAGYRGEEYPKSFVWENTRLVIEKIERRWLEPGFRYFEVKSAEGRFFLLRFSEIEPRWEGRVLNQK